MSTINIEVTKNVYDVDLQHNVTSYEVTLEKGYYPLPVGLENYYTKPETNLLLENYYLKTETYSNNEIDNLLDLKADLSQLNNYYTKSETFSQSQINTALGLKLDKGSYTGTAQSLKNEIDSKQNLLSSFDESILIETDGNIEGNVSLFEEYFEQKECELNFTPIQIIGVYLNGVKQKPSLYTITLPKTISVTNFSSGDYIEIQYTKLKI
jgi:predicted XRE-type DNA-binding protein